MILGQMQQAIIQLTKKMDSFIVTQAAELSRNHIKTRSESISTISSSRQHDKSVSNFNTTNDYRTEPWPYQSNNKNIFDYVKNKCTILAQQDKSQSYAKKMTILTNLKIDRWDETLHVSAISHLWDNYQLRLEETGQFTVMEIAAFSHRAFQPSIKSVITPIIEEACAQYVEIEIKIDNLLAKNLMITPILQQERLTEQVLRVKIFWKLALAIQPMHGLLKQPKFETNKGITLKAHFHRILELTQMKKNDSLTNYNSLDLTDAFKLMVMGLRQEKHGILVQTLLENELLYKVYHGVVQTKSTLQEIDRSLEKCFWKAKGKVEGEDGYSQREWVVFWGKGCGNKEGTFGKPQKSEMGGGGQG